MSPVNAAPIISRLALTNPFAPHEQAVCVVRPVEGSSDYEVLWDGGFMSNGDERAVRPTLRAALELQYREVNQLARDWYEGEGY